MRNILIFILIIIFIIISCNNPSDSKEDEIPDEKELPFPVPEDLVEEVEGKIVLEEDGKIYTMKDDGSEKKLILNESGGHYSWSPDGNTIAFQYDVGTTGGLAIYLLDKDGTNLRPMYQWRRYPEFGDFPVWSKDSRELYYSWCESCGMGIHKHNILKYNFEQDTIFQLTNTPDCERVVDVSMDGQTLLINFNDTLYITDSSGIKYKELFVDSLGIACWSYDEKLIAFRPKSELKLYIYEIAKDYFHPVDIDFENEWFSGILKWSKRNKYLYIFTTNPNNNYQVSIKCINLCTKEIELVYTHPNLLAADWVQTN